MRILLCFGTRPEWLKIKPLTKVLQNYELLFTGQHTDLLKDISTDYQIKINQNKNRLDQVVSDCLLQFPDGDFDTVLVQGDTVSAFACALAAFHRGKKICHLEAGLRTYNLKHPYPEESYRQMISRISDVNLCPTSLSKGNLLNELASGDSHVVGNTVLDNLLSYKDKCEYTNKILVTLHRRENHSLIHNWFSKINNLAEKYSDLEFILPIHPNPEVTKHRNLLSHVNVVEPLEHSMLLDILAKCKLVISDSGGLQEESSFLKKKIIVCRKTTERPEGKESGQLSICESPDDLHGIFEKLIYNYEIDEDCPYGNGRSSEKIASILNEN
jgi:UDP-N-acetylglucosamine 2-epimerase (non-hydrolysing)|tara:strand:+ start:255 stop:1238 length:984 start_codon:yes stop_codon:yes gene_type:complete